VRKRGKAFPAGTTILLHTTRRWLVLRAKENFCAKTLPMTGASVKTWHMFVASAKLKRIARMGCWAGTMARRRLISIRRQRAKNAGDIALGPHLIIARLQAGG